MKNFWKWLFPDGFRFSWSSGQAFNLTDQERTDGVQDIIKSKEAREKKK